MRAARKDAPSRRVLGVTCELTHSGFVESFFGVRDDVEVFDGVGSVGRGLLHHVVSLNDPRTVARIVGRASSLAKAEERVVEKHRGLEESAAAIRAYIERGDDSGVEVRRVAGADGEHAAHVVSARSAQGVIVRACGVGSTLEEADASMRERASRLFAGLRRIGLLIANARPPS